MSDEEISLIADEAFVPTRFGLLVIDEQASITEWVKFGKQLREVDGAVQWLIGDWLNYGEIRYGEKYKLAIEATGYDYGLLRDEKWMARRFKLSSRHDKVSWSHHREVAGLDDEIANNLLSMAEENKWSEKHLRSEVKKIKNLPAILAEEEVKTEAVGELERPDTEKSSELTSPLRLTLPARIVDALLKYELKGGNTNYLVAILLAEWLMTNNYLPKNYKLP